MEVAAASLAECCRWGDEQLGGARRGSTGWSSWSSRRWRAADASGMPLFAAWRAMPFPDDSPGAPAAAGLHLLREHFTGAYLVAVRASGMTPLEAVLAGPEGETGAVACGWPPPYPPVGPLVRRRLWAEAVTNRLAGSAFAALGAGGAGGTAGRRTEPGRHTADRKDAAPATPGPVRGVSRPGGAG